MCFKALLQKVLRLTDIAKLLHVYIDYLSITQTGPDGTRIKNRTSVKIKH